MTNSSPRTFGELLREKRIERGFSLRKFAQAVGVSPTYLSQVEQSNVDPPTADRVKRMAELLDENVDEWTALAGRISEDLPDIIHDAPTQVPDILRALRGMSPDQLRKIRKAVEELKRQPGDEGGESSEK